MGVEAVLYLLLVTLITLGGTVEGQTCIVSNIAAKSNLNLTRFQGQWYALFINEFVKIEIPVLNQNRNTMENTQSYYRLLPNGSMALMTSGTLTPNNCYKFRGISSLTNESGVLRHDMNILGVTTDSEEVRVLDTDYNSYAITYSCREKLPDGTCAPGKDFLWGLSRTLKDFSPAIKKRMAALARRACITTKNFKSIRHRNGQCAINPRNFQESDLSSLFPMFGK